MIRYACRAAVCILEMYSGVEVVLILFDVCINGTACTLEIEVLKFHSL